MKDSTYDQFLVMLALLAPLAMFALGKWRTSLDTWYAPLDGPGASDFGERFEKQATAWVKAEGGDDARLIVIADPECPCTRVTLKKLDEALALSPRRDVRLVIRDVHDQQAVQNAAWAQLLNTVPATPTLLAVEGKQLLYAGPVTSGNFCTTAVGRVLGGTALQSPRTGVLLDLIDRGCYCRMPSA